MMEELNPLLVSLMPFCAVSWSIGESIRERILRTYCGPAFGMGIEDTQAAVPFINGLVLQLGI